MDTRYFLDRLGKLHKREFGLNELLVPDGCKAHNAALVDPVAASDLRKHTGEDRCDACFPKAKSE